jgi:hypothetical protein
MDGIETHVVQVQGPPPDSDDQEHSDSPHTSHMEMNLSPGQEGFTSQVLALAQLLTAIDNCAHDDVRALGLRFAESLGAQPAAEKSKVLTLAKR